MNAPTLGLVPQREVPLIEIVIEEVDGIPVMVDVPCPACLRGDPTPHNASERCESGGYSHCTCDTCF